MVTVMSMYEPETSDNEAQRPLRRTEYDQLVREGFFVDDKIELLRGRMVPMSPQGTGHAETLRRLNRLLNAALLERADIQVQSPIAASDESEPEPDIAVIPRGTYLDDHPSQAFLIVEIAESSIARDRRKANIYASMKIPEYWLVDVKRRIVEVRTEPEGGEYLRVVPRRDEDSITLTAFPDVALRVSDILPPRS